MGVEGHRPGCSSPIDLDLRWPVQYNGQIGGSPFMLIPIIELHTKTVDAPLWVETPTPAANSTSFQSSP